MGKDLRGKELGVGFYQRPDKRYEAKAMVNGIKIDLYNMNLKQLREDFEIAKAEAKNGLDLKFKTMTLNDWFEEWFEKYRKPYLRSTSINPIRTKYNSIFRKPIGDLKIRDVTNLHIQKVISAEVEAGRATSTLREAVGLLRRCLESARNNGIVKVNPCYDIQVPWSESKAVLRRYLNDEELKIFLDAVKDDYYKEMYYVMIYTGLRIGEVGGLQWKDVDFRGKCVRVNQALCCEYKDGVKTLKLGPLKTPNSYRVIPFFEDVESNFLAWKAKQDSIKKQLGKRWRCPAELGDLVFTNTMGAPIIRHIAESQMRKVVDRINFERQIESNRSDSEYIPFEPVYPHACRHTFCSMCFSRGINPKVVQGLMGHANYSTTIGIYTHIFQEDYEKEVAKFNRVDMELEQPELDADVLQEILRTRGSNKLD